MTVSPIVTDFTPYGWIDFTRLTCDVCGATYPPNGLLAEHPLVLFDARNTGWSLMPLAGLACCPDCHMRAVNGAEDP